jgi:hypothetical protein
MASDNDLGEYFDGCANLINFHLAFSFSQHPTNFFERRNFGLSAYGPQKINLT